MPRKPRYITRAVKRLRALAKALRVRHQPEAASDLHALADELESPRLRKAKQAPTK